MTKEQTKKSKHQYQHPAPKKVFDVTRPGKVSATATSRPVLPSQKPPVADDQFVPSAPPVRASDPDLRHDLMDGKHKKAVEPLTEPAVPQTATHDNALQSAAPGDQPQTAATTPAAAASDNLAGDTPLLPDSVAPGSPAGPDGAPAAPGETPAHLLMEQTVETDTPQVPIWEHPDTSQQVETAEPPHSTGPTSGGSRKSIEDLLAETGAPVLDSEPSPSLIISHHKARQRGHGWKVLIWTLLLVVVLGAAAVNVLLDADILTGVDLPHTNFL